MAIRHAFQKMRLFLDFVLTEQLSFLSKRLFMRKKTPEIGGS